MNRESAHWELVPDDSDDVPIVRYLLAGQGRTAKDMGNSAAVIFYGFIVGALTVVACLVF